LRWDHTAGDVTMSSDGPLGLKSRRRVSGLRRTMRWREAHRGGRRSAMSCHQRRPSSATSAGVRRSAIAALQ
jgi:hypothetical protein